MNIYKVNYLTGVNRIQKIYVFSGDQDKDLASLFVKEPSNSIFTKIFNSQELSYIQNQRIEVVFSKQSIHYDDAIGIIKAKVNHELKTKSSIPEMFMFAMKEYTIQMSIIYNALTLNKKIPLTKTRVSYFFMNIVKDVNGDSIKINLPEKDVYTYKDLMDLQIEGKKVFINYPLGKRHIIQDKQYPFICNPFEFHQEDPTTEKIIRDNIYTLNNNLLLSGGQVSYNNIYLCLAKDILQYRDTASTINIYFPLLYTRGIRNIDLLNDEQSKLIEESKSKYTPSIFESVDLFYKINSKSSNKLEYVNKGIKSIQIIIRQMYSLKIPNDVMFKIYHASKDTPFVKYNPGEGQEKLIRLYADKMTSDGKKIPYLSKSKIRNFIKTITPRGHSIAIFFEDINAQCIMNEQGDIHVSMVFSEAMSLENLNEMLYEKLNSKLEIFQDYLGQHGYTISIFNGLYHNTTDIKDMSYQSSVIIKKPFMLNDLKGCVSSVFVLENNNIKDGITARYKRVANFNQMTSMEAFVVEKQKAGNDYQDIVEQLIIVYPNLSEEEAINLVGKLASELQVERGVRKNVIDLKENPGFRTEFKFDPITSELSLVVSGIDDVQYIDLIPIYLDSLVQLTQFKKDLGVTLKKINEICKKEYKKETVFEEIVPEIDQSYNDKVEKEEQKIEDDEKQELRDEESDYEEDAIDLFFGEDEEESEEESSEAEEIDSIQGGEKNTPPDGDENLVKDVSKLKLNNPYYFQKRMMDRDPVLIMTEKKGKFSEYSRICHENVRRQPVILNQQELDKINEEHPGFLKEESDIVKYGSNPDKQFYYICPRYWDLKRNTLVTPKEIKEKNLQDKIIPLEEKTPGPGKYIYEFTAPRDGSNTPYPGLIPDKHPEGHCLPCCFKTWKADSQVERKKNLCLGKDVPETRKIEKDDYILGPGKFPLNQDKWGYLPTNIQKVLSYKQTECEIGKPCVLRHGVEYSKNQSFLAAISDALFYVKNSGSVPTIKQTKEKIVGVLTLDNFITFQNGNLITEFYDQTKKVDSGQPKYRETKLYSRTKNDKSKLEFYKKVCNSFEQFVKYIQNENIDIDYTFLWDLISTPNPLLFENGINLVIFKSPNEDNTDNLNLICPTNHYTSRYYDPNKPTLLLYNEDQFFEPIYTLIRIFEGNKEIKGIIQLFKENDANLTPEIKYIFELIIKPFYDKMCKPMASMPRVYKAKQPILLDKLIDECKKLEYTIKKQAVNLQGKVVGLLVKMKKIDAKGIIPCYPSAINSNYSYDFVLEDYFWSDYKKTTLFLQNVKKDSAGSIPCSPIFKVIEDEVIVGIITETNQFIQLSVPEPISNIKDNLKELRNNNYVINKDSSSLKGSDTIITEDNGEDEERKEFVKKIQLETRFYEAFRNTVKVILNKTENVRYKEEIENTIDNLGMIYSQKLPKIDEKLRLLVGNMAMFVKDYNYQMINNIQTCATKKNDNKCREQSPLCSVISEGKCQIMLPKQNLLNGIDNEKNYYLRLADELIRYKRIQQFMFLPQMYLSFGKVDLLVNDDEIVILQSMLTEEFFEGLVDFQPNPYLKSNTYDTATPSITETYSAEITV